MSDMMPEKMWLIENHKANEDDDYRQIFTPDADWIKIHDGYDLMAEYTRSDLCAEKDAEIEAARQLRQKQFEEIEKYKGILNEKDAVIKELAGALKMVGVAGNHLWCVIPQDHLPHSKTTDEALMTYGAGDIYDTWVAWKICYEAYIVFLKHAAQIKDGG